MVGWQKNRLLTGNLTSPYYFFSRATQLHIDTTHAIDISSELSKTLGNENSFFVTAQNMVQQEVTKEVIKIKHYT